MKVVIELEDYEPWGGAVDVYKRIKMAGKLEDFDDFLDQVYSGFKAISITDLNDLLWFESDAIYSFLGIK